MEDVTPSELERFCESSVDSPGDSEIDARVGMVFDPTDEEMMDILDQKMSDTCFYDPAIFEENVYGFEPYQLRGLPAIESKGNFYFLFELNPLHASGKSYRRSTKRGYWKVTAERTKIESKRTKVRGERKTLVFYEKSRDHPKGVKTNWYMYEYSAYADNNPLFKKDLVVCRITEKKPTSSAKDEKKDPAECGVKEDGKKKRPRSTKDETKDLVLCGRKEDRKKKRLGSTKDEKRRDKRPLISNYDGGQPSNFAAIDNGNHVAEKSSPEPQPPNRYLISNPSVAVENTYQLDSLPPESLNALYGSPPLDQTSFPVQSPVIRLHGSSSSYVSSNENEVLNSPIDSESQWEDFLQWPLVTQDESTGEATGLLGGLWDSSDVGTEFLNEWLDEAFWTNTS